MSTLSPGKRSAPLQILLVDDNRMGLRARRMVLEELGYQVTPVDCGVEAFELFCAESYDLVVTDYKMPKLDGIQLIARIHEQRPETPVILLSGFAEALGLDEGNTGADIVIQKNCHEVATLTRSVTRLLTRRPPKKPVGIESTPLSRAAVAGR